MPSRCRLHYAAAGGWLVAAILLACPALGQEENPKEAAPVSGPSEQASEPDKKPTPDDLDSAFWKSKDGSPGVYREICEKPKDREQADLCQQWRTAEAAEKQAEWARLQFWASALGIFGLLATIFYTHKSYRLSARTARRQLRAYLAVDDGVVVPQSRPQQPNFQLNIPMFNRGQTPAYDVTYVAKVYITKGVVPPPGFNVDLVQHPIHSRATLYPNQHLFMYCFMEPVSDHVLRNIMSVKDETCLAVYGRVTYTDTFGEKRFTNFSSVIVRNAANNTWHWMRTQPHNDSN